MKTLIRVAAVIFLAAGTIAGFTFLSVGQSVSFADVARQLRDTRTLSANLATTLPDGKTIRAKLFYDAGGRYRTEADPVTTVTDWKRGVTLALDKTHKRATLLDARVQGAEAGASHASSEFLDQLLHVEASGGKPVGERAVGDHPAKVFEIVQEGRKAVIWVDAKTGKPLRLEMSFRPAAGEQAVSVVMDDLVINPKFDEGLFSTKVPEGYFQEQVAVTIPAGRPSETDVVEFLRKYAAEFGGAFPPGLEPAQWAGPLKAKTAAGAGAPEPQRRPSVELFVLSGRVTMFLGALAHGYQYAGNGVRLGEGDEVVFWYPQDDTSEYRAVYGDLRTATVPAANVPSAGTK